MKTEPGCYNIGIGCHSIGFFKECIHCNIALKAGGLITQPPRSSRPALKFAFYTNEAGRIDYAEVSEGDNGN